MTLILYNNLAPLIYTVKTNLKKGVKKQIIRKKGIEKGKKKGCSIHWWVQLLTLLRFFAFSRHIEHITSFSESFS